MNAISATDRKAFFAIIAVSVLAFAFLVWLIYVNEGVETKSDVYLYLPAVNAALNGLSALSICLGLAAIKTKRRRLHISLMITAFLFSTLFLVNYIVYHAAQGDTKFLGEGLVRVLYFFILISHIGATVFALPLILTTFYLAVTKQFERHKKIARITFPLWLYVSVTGVAIYFLLKTHSQAGLG
jgi:putative membrane protein